jgi:hypothetical protein
MNMGKRTQKLLVYLDQNFLSEMSKAGINEKVRPEFRDIYELLHQGFLDEKLVVPGSLLHDIESSLATHLGTAFPDCEAIREVEPGRWQRVRIEFEYESRNFMHHFHDPTECDLIVCWKHNWAESPLEVVELEKAFSLQ